MTEENKSYSGAYTDRIKELYELIAGREGFKYSPSEDPNYHSYRQDYERQGRLAMRDAVAQAAHLSGGYGNSYAQSAGQQAYGSYLEKLNAALPELYSAAYQRYVDEGDRLNQQLSAAMGMDANEYQHYADERDWQMAEDKFDYQKQSDAYDRLFELIQYAGYAPSEEELAASGMSASQAQALKQKAASRSSGGGGYSSLGWGANRFTYKDYDPYAASSGSNSTADTAGGKKEPSASLVIKTHS